VRHNGEFNATYLRMLFTCDDQDEERSRENDGRDNYSHGEC